MGAINYDYIRLLVNGLTEFRREGILCDIIFELRDGTVPAHSVILASVSRKLRPVFTENVEPEAHYHRIEMPDFGKDAMSWLLEYVYTGEKGTPMSPASTCDVISLFETLEIPAPVDWIIPNDRSIPGK